MNDVLSAYAEAMRLLNLYYYWLYQPQITVSNTSVPQKEQA